MFTAPAMPARFADIKSMVSMMEIISPAPELYGEETTESSERKLGEARII